MGPRTASRMVPPGLVTTVVCPGVSRFARGLAAEDHPRMAAVLDSYRRDCRHACTPPRLDLLRGGRPLPALAP